MSSTKSNNPLTLANGSIYPKSTWTKENSLIVSFYENSMTLKELKSLKKEMGRIKKENEILKNAIAIQLITCYGFTY